MIIAVDTGNKQMKTAGNAFVSGFIESETPPPFGENTLQYKGKYYSLSSQRTPYMRDKTKDDRFFILTLFAIAAELERRCIYEPGELMAIQLLIGLPPAHYGSLHKSFEEYYRAHKEDIFFVYNKVRYSVYINDVASYPQAYAAAIPNFGNVKEIPKAVVLDWGGYTFDYVQLKNGKVDMSVCDSLEHGVIMLYNRVRSKVNSQLDILLDESDIDAIVQETPNGFSNEVVALVRRTTQQFVADVLGGLRELGIDLKSCHAVFVGGGAVLLREFIQASGKIAAATYVTDIHANAKGYELLYKLAMTQKGRR